MDDLTPAYAIYEQGALSKLALINYMDYNQKGSNDLKVTVQLPDGAPHSVQVKYVENNLPLGDWLIDLFSYFIGICLLLLFRIDTILRGLVR